MNRAYIANSTFLTLCSEKSVSRFFCRGYWKKSYVSEKCSSLNTERITRKFGYMFESWKPSIQITKWMGVKVCFCSIWGLSRTLSPLIKLHDPSAISECILMGLACAAGYTWAHFFSRGKRANNGFLCSQLIYCGYAYSVWFFNNANKKTFNVRWRLRFLKS